MEDRMEAISKALRGGLPRRHAGVPAGRPAAPRPAPLAVWVIVAAAAVFAGCATTGDPRQGGLFGWSEREAMERERALRQEARDAQAAARTESDAGRAAQDRAAGLRRQEAQAQAELDRLLSENDGLQLQLRQLMSRVHLGAQDLARLNDVLAGNSRVLALLRARATQAPTRPSDATMRQLDDQNASLRREVQHLLER